MTTDLDALGDDRTAALAQLLHGATDHGGSRALMQLIALQQQQQQDAEEERPISAIRADEQRRRNRALRIKRHIGALQDEVDELRHRNDALADALGACRLCWGEHDDCTACGGRGRPGWYRPDLAGARQLLGPAIDRLRFEQRRSRPLAPPNPNDPPARFDEHEKGN